MPSAPAPSLIKQYILKQVLDELQAELIDAKGRKTTKGQALVRGVFSQALEGDGRQAAQMLKWIDQAADLENIQENSDYPTEAAAWEALFLFYGKYKPLLDMEIEKRRASQPHYWDFDWARLEPGAAPWHNALHGDSGNAATEEKK